jgi:type IV secretion system protein VirB5
MASDAKASIPSNPYLNARREWDERYGDQISRARSWRITAFASLAVAGIAVVGIMVIGSQSKIKPYVVAIDKLGNPIAMAQPVSGSAIDQRIIEAQLANWVWDARTVIPDPVAQKNLINKVYAMTSSAAATYLNQYYTQHSPFGDFTVNVQINSILPISKDTWQVSWEEARFQNGQPQPLQHWKANITTGVDQKLGETPQVQIDNPLGLFIRSVSWTQVI